MVLSGAVEDVKSEEDATKVVRGSCCGGSAFDAAAFAPAASNFSELARLVLAAFRVVTYHFPGYNIKQS